jgi:hypothetical protein
MVPVLLLTAVIAQGPIETSLAREAVTLAQTTTTPPPAPPRPHRKLTFWTGIGLVGAGALAQVLAVTTEQQSEIPSPQHGGPGYSASLQPYINNVNGFAPCGTAFDSTTRPIAPCKAHKSLLYTGAGVTGTGVALIYLSLRK